MNMLKSRRRCPLMVVLLALVASCLALHGFFMESSSSAPPSSWAASVQPVRPPRVVLGNWFSGMLEQSDSWVMGFLVFCLCCKLCGDKLPEGKVEVVPFDKRADSDRITYMNAYLALMSGMVNAIAFIGMGMTVSHHTGNATHTGRTWSTSGMKFLSVILAFMVGSGVVGANTVDTEAWIKGRYSGPLMASALAVASAMIIKDATGSTVVALLLLSFSQGILNAITRKCTAMPICGSHVTGYATDAGSILGAWLKAMLTNKEPPPLKKPTIFIFAMITFALGGFIATLLMPQLGLTSLALPAAGTALAAAGLV